MGSFQQPNSVEFASAWVELALIGASQLVAKLAARAAALMARRVIVRFIFHRCYTHDTPYLQASYANSVPRHKREDHIHPKCCHVPCLRGTSMSRSGLVTGRSSLCFVLVFAWCSVFAATPAPTTPVTRLDLHADWQLQSD